MALPDIVFAKQTINSAFVFIRTERHEYGCISHIHALTHIHMPVRLPHALEAVVQSATRRHRRSVRISLLYVEHAFITAMSFMRAFVPLSIN